ncbi:uncharacterized protein Z520_06790 [Fonsecaea multimorphosa CBS 102226]|uniref:FAD-binding domain-containing protein n=1 Tax=Fonsecaea multimorphosa CBS 102226 TaxID=1442371 RepID=A0A0D2KL61_9EURO|nr:uncharacterized protein Z520_06790 [Fonsecaea multimorphosa CBS 102226]KIX97338.1 hypothetical protein Z520_06790 [Fonsecaea multimorphosa CBS 102226]
MSKVLVVGCGIIGPTIAIMLRQRGYEVTIVERIQRPESAAGVSLALQPNGQASSSPVLDTIGLANIGEPVLNIRDYNADGEYLGGLDISYAKEQYGFWPAFVRRGVLLQTLKAEAVRLGVQIHEDWELHDIDDLENGVVATTKDGRTISASFVVACDGLHSTTRKIINQKHGISEPPANATGQLSLSGIAPTPKSLAPQTVSAWMGESRLVVAFEVSRTHSGWTMILSTGSEKDTWRQVDKLEETRAELLDAVDGWPDAVRDLLESTEFILRFGHFDRPTRAPEHWYHERCVLLGDAAHPSSPHRGQGANQGLEDCWVLNQVLPGANKELSTVELATAFASYAKKRQARTAVTVQTARSQGTERVAAGREAGLVRDKMIREQWADQEAARAAYHDLWKEPY